MAATPPAGFAINRAGIFIATLAAFIGVASEVVAFNIAISAGWIPDLAVGWVCVAAGLIVNGTARGSWTGHLLVGTGFAWFIGNFGSVEAWPIAAFAAGGRLLHRGLLIHTVLTLPTGRVNDRLTFLVIAAGYITSFVAAWSSGAAASGGAVAISVAVAAVAVRGFIHARGPARHVSARVVMCSLGCALALVGPGIGRAIFPSPTADWALLGAYEATLVAVVLVVARTVVRPPSQRTALTDLVVELADHRSGMLRDALAHSLGDPSLAIGYWHGGSKAYLDDSGTPVDAAGQTVILPLSVAGRTVTPVMRHGLTVAAVVHEAAAADSRSVQAAIGAAARLAVDNERLQAELNAQLRDLRASRTAIVVAGDTERERLERNLHDGAQQRLLALLFDLRLGREALRQTSDKNLLDNVDHAIDQTLAAVSELREIAHGIYPAILTESGLRAALLSLADASPALIVREAPAERLAERVERTVYVIVAEAIDRARPSSFHPVHVRVVKAGDRVVVEMDRVDVNAQLAIADRLAAVGGTMVGDGAGLRAEIPCA